MTEVSAIVTKADGSAEVREITLQPLAPDQVRIRLAAAGLCHSDLSARDGVMRWPTPMVLGHEAAGIVTEVGTEVTSVRPGDRVATSWIQPCGSCHYCRRAQHYLCERSGPDSWERPYAMLDGDRLDAFLGVGAFAEQTTVLDRACIPLPQDTPMDIAALVSCGITTGWGAVVRAARVTPGSTVAVIGCGGVGLAAIQTAKHAGATRVAAVDLHEDRLDMATRLGADEVVAAADTDTVKALRAMTGGDGFDVVIEAVGRSTTIRQALKATRRGGTTVIAGVGRADDLVEISAMELYWMARTIVGCVFGDVEPARDIPRVLDHALLGHIDVRTMITDEVTLPEIPEALRRLERGEGLRTVVHFPGWEELEQRLHKRDLPLHDA